MLASYDSKSPESIKAEILAALSDTVETREGSFANTLVSPVAYQLYKVYQLLPQIEAMVLPDASSGEYLDRRAADFGLTRIDGTKATVTLRFTAYTNTTVGTIPAGTGVTTSDGLVFYTTEAGDLTDGTVDIPAEAAAVGRAYNVDPYTLTTLLVNSGTVAYVTNPLAAVGGTDVESDEEFLARYRAYLQRPVSSGNAAHYVQWATEVSGVVNAAVEPLWDGNGTVKVVVGGPDMEPVDETIVEACAEHIEAERPIGATVTVVSVEALAVNAEATVVLIEGYTAQQVQDEFEAALGKLLAGMSFGETNILRYSRVLALLLDCEGVEEYTALTVNDAKANVTAAPEQVLTLGTVIVSEASAAEAVSEE
jgi:uncharacterized phage protein gp47/JayE